MKTYTKAKRTRGNATSKKNRQVDTTSAPHVANGKTTVTPNYSKMKQKIEEIKDAVPFDKLKDFFGLN